MKYKCAKCGLTIKVTTREPISLRCTSCGGVEGSFIGNIKKIECGHCGEIREIQEEEVVDIRNNCFASRTLGPITLWKVRGGPFNKGNREKKK